MLGTVQRWPADSEVEQRTAWEEIYSKAAHEGNKNKKLVEQFQRSNISI